MRKIEITISDQIKLDAGTIEESQDYFLVQPLTVPMIEQLITQLDALPQCEGDFQIQHLGVAFTALCVRWGSYLSTLMDPTTDLHPAIPGFHKKQPQEYGFISDSEMQRLNIEISYNVYHLAQILRERESIGLTKLLWKAYAYSPMSHKSIPKNVREAKIIYAAVLAGMHTTRNSTEAEVTTGGNGSSKPQRRQIARADADRFLANALTCQAWRATLIEDIHAGYQPPQGLRPHQQRFTRNIQLAILREVTANFGSILFAMNMLFDEHYDGRGIAPWPETARTLKKPRKCAGFSLCSVAVVVVDDPTENVAAAHLSLALGTRFGDWNLLIKPLMRACRVEEFSVFAHDPSQMGLIDD